jgi:H+/Cl- antiporter ClcA
MAIHLLPATVRAMGPAVIVGGLCGAMSATFLTLLDWATQFRESHRDIVWALPVAGLFVGWLWHRYAGPTNQGSNLILDSFHEDTSAPIPLRMAPMVLLGTIVTHLFGGSAGREGTAVQMGAAVADQIANRWAASAAVRQHLLVAGVAGGFGSVFGTPLAGALFAMEWLVVGKVRFRFVSTALAAAFVGDAVTDGLGIVHTPFPSVSMELLNSHLWMALGVLALATALVAVTFIELTHTIKAQLKRFVPAAALRPLVGGLIVVILWQIVGTDLFLGLGVPTIERAFLNPVLPLQVFALKLVFTAMTVGSGFPGGEVTPLFFIGAALGSALAPLLGIPGDLAAGIGLVAMFGAAANTPLALAVMAGELMGWQIVPPALVVCLLATQLTGRRSIYTAQRMTRGKWGQRLAEPEKVGH